MLWKDYQNFIDRKVSDAKYNYEIAERRFNEAKLEYEKAVREKESFEKAIEEKLNQLEQQEGE